MTTREMVMYELEIGNGSLPRPKAATPAADTKSVAVHSARARIERLILESLEPSGGTLYYAPNTKRDGDQSCQTRHQFFF